MFFFSVPPEKKQPKRELVARFESEQITALRTVLRNSLRSNSPRTAYGTVLSPCICYLPLSLSQHL